MFHHYMRQRAETEEDLHKPESAREQPPAEVNFCHVRHVLSTHHFIAMIQQTHVDQNYWAALERIRMHHGEETLSRVLSGKARAIICNVWRPLVGPVLERPVAVADRRTVIDERDLAMTLPPSLGCRTGESQMLRYHPDQRWYYVSQMQTDECLLLKIFDSKSGVGSPHSVRHFLVAHPKDPKLTEFALVQAFQDPGTPANAPPRWSIEVRTVIVLDEADGLASNV